LLPLTKTRSPNFNGGLVPGLATVVGEGVARFKLVLDPKAALEGVKLGVVGRLNIPLALYWAGVELDEKQGKNDGAVAGKR
jgi:hypothetical protein